MRKVNSVLSYTIIWSHNMETSKKKDLRQTSNKSSKQLHINIYKVEEKTDPNFLCTFTDKNTFFSQYSYVEKKLYQEAVSYLSLYSATF